MFRVIIVDDHPMVSAALKDLLETQEHFEVVAVHDNGGAALSAVRTLQPDLLIIDLGVPVLGGVEVISRLRAGGAQFGILVVSGGESHESGLRALRAGANGFLLKDTAPTEILDAVRRVAAGESMLSPAVLTRLIDTVVRGGAAPAGGPGSAARALLGRLTGREREVADAVAAGRSNAEIAAQLYMSVATVKATVSRLFTKLECTNRVQIAIVVHESRT